MKAVQSEPLQPLDLMVLLALVAPASRALTVRELAAALAAPKSLVGRSLQRLRAHALVSEDAGERRINRILARELLTHGVRWIAPARIGRVTLGLATAHAAPPLSHRLPGDADPVVIPLDEGPVRGRSVTPLHPCAGVAASKDQKLHELLAIVDGIRIGGAREREIATAELVARL